MCAEGDGEGVVCAVERSDVADEKDPQLLRGSQRGLAEQMVAEGVTPMRALCNALAELQPEVDVNELSNLDPHGIMLGSALECDGGHVRHQDITIELGDDESSKCELKVLPGICQTRGEEVYVFKLNHYVLVEPRASWYERMSVRAASTFRFHDKLQRMREDAVVNHVLQDVSLVVRPGELLAIVGPSGSGKSTLLKALLGQGRGKFTGQIELGGEVPNRTTRHTLGYVLETDVFLSNLTVFEAIMFTANVRAVQRYPSLDERAQFVNRLIDRLALTRVRNHAVRTLSTGEAKRLAIANELVADPPILLLDEPTSGLDSYSAERVVELLEQIALEGKTVVTTIHQPSSQMFHRFTKLLMLVDGKTAYFGRASLAADYLTGLGFAVPVTYNVVDFFMQLLLDPGYVNGQQLRDILVCEWNKRVEAVEELAPRLRRHTAFQRKRWQSGSLGSGSRWMEKFTGVAGGSTPPLSTTTSCDSLAQETFCAVPVKVGVCDVVEGACESLKDSHGYSGDVRSADDEKNQNVCAEVLPNIDHNRVANLWRDVTARALGGTQQLAMKCAVRDAHAAEAHFSPEMRPTLLPAVELPSEVKLEELCDLEAPKLLNLTRDDSVALAKQARNQNRSKFSYGVGWWDQFVAIYMREFIQRRRATFNVYVAAQYIVMILIATLLWIPTQNTEEFINDRLGYLFFSSIFFAYVGMFNPIASIPAEARVIKKERQAYFYRMSAYVAAKSCAELPLELVWPSIYVVASYWSVGMNPSVGRFTMFWVIELVTVLTANSMGFFLIAATMNPSGAGSIATVIQWAGIVLGGYYVERNNLPPFIKEIRWVSFLEYTYSSFILNEYGGASVPCTNGYNSVYDNQGCPITDTAIYKGAGLLLPGPGIGFYFGMLIVLFVVFRILGFVCLHYRFSKR
mmetsp:Transcript_11914/g.32055  ORF Transcript_11914/g.32055 Transcript_11914/m.32055 type:complete len:912 (-) Transcript_11914:385-3120(-)